MVLTLGVAIVVVVIGVACIGPLYYCKQSNEGYGDEIDESSTVDIPVIQVKISHQNRGAILNNFTPEKEQNSKENSVDTSNEIEKTHVQDDVTTPTPEVPRVIPVKPPRNRQKIRQKDSTIPSLESSKPSTSKNDRSSRSIWSSCMRSQLESITNSTTEGSVARKVVRTRVQVHPRDSTLISTDAPDPLIHESHTPIDADTVNQTINHSQQNDGRTKKLSATVKKWKILRKSLKFARSEKSMSLKDIRTDETQRLDIPVSVTRQRSPIGHSTILQKNRLIDASTSTRISSNVLDPRETAGNEIVKKSYDESSNELISLESAESEVLRDVVSLIKRRSTDEKSTCYVRTAGLRMSQSELPRLIEAIGSKVQSASVVMTEEASVISIKLHRDRRTNITTETRVENSSFECPLRKLYKSLPARLEDISFSKLFLPQEELVKPDYKIQSTRISDGPETLNLPINESSYMKLPKRNIKIVDNESLIDEIIRKFTSIIFWK